ncbi:hypothetical protein HDU92_005590 [Lobulomyces angularis]|nr:hypothetical protein HDU92_005590 [Lobulomyces angularis]
MECINEWYPLTDKFGQRLCPCDSEVSVKIQKQIEQLLESFINYRNNTKDLTGTLSNRRQTFYYLIALGVLCKFLWKDDFTEQTSGWRRWRQSALDLRNIRDELCHNPYMSCSSPEGIYPLDTDVRKNLAVLCVEKANALEELKIYLTKDFY